MNFCYRRSFANTQRVSAMGKMKISIFVTGNSSATAYFERHRQAAKKLTKNYKRRGPVQTRTQFRQLMIASSPQARTKLGQNSDSIVLTKALKKSRKNRRNISPPQSQK